MREDETSEEDCKREENGYKSEVGHGIKASLLAVRAGRHALP